MRAASSIFYSRPKKDREGTFVVVMDKQVSASTASALMRPLVEAMKGVAILLIVGVHVRRGWFGWQGVHVFIVLGGFTLALSSMKSPAKWRDWLYRRAIRILPTFWVVAVGGYFAALLLPLNALRGQSGSTATPAMLFVRDLTLTRNFSVDFMFGPVNASLWYVPLLFGLYACFPPIMEALRRTTTRIAIAQITAGIVLVEMLARAGAVMLLDGMPVGFGHGFLPMLGAVEQPLDRLAPAVAFQLWAPFGVFPTRLGEFALGMAAGVVWSRAPEQSMRALQSSRTCIVALLLWFAGSLLVYRRVGWAAADLLIAAGLTLVLAHALLRLRSRLPRITSKMEWLGGWSYYLFLVHLFIGSIAASVATRLQITTVAHFVLLVVAVIIAVVGACRLLRLVDVRVQHWLGS